MSGPVRRYSAWTADDDDLLKAMLSTGKGVTLAALKLKRSQSSVKRRAYTLRISLKDGQSLDVGAPQK